MEADHQYFSRRAKEERAAADAASSIEARTAHLELASRYSDLAKAMDKHRLHLKL
jgi:hypothetical protein